MGFPGERRGESTSAGESSGAATEAPGGSGHCRVRRSVCGCCPNPRAKHGKGGTESQGGMRNVGDEVC